MVAGMGGRLVTYDEVEQMSKYSEDNGSHICHCRRRV